MFRLTQTLVYRKGRDHTVRLCRTKLLIRNYWFLLQQNRKADINISSLLTDLSSCDNTSANQSHTATINLSDYDDEFETSNRPVKKMCTSINRADDDIQPQPCASSLHNSADSDNDFEQD